MCRGRTLGITALVLLLTCAGSAVMFTVDDGSGEDHTRIQDAVDNLSVVDNSESMQINQSAVDSDGDGISDHDEINGFKWNSIMYYTDPLQKSTDFDPYDDYKEITTINMDPTVLSPGRHPAVPSYPDLKIEIGKVEVNTLTKITSTETRENNTAWDIDTLTVDVTKENWGANTEAKVGWSLTEGVYAYAKAYAYYDYLHLLTAISTGTTSGWSKEAWNMATAVDADKAARLKFHLKIRNNGTDTAKNVQLKFNAMIGDNIITTKTTDKVANRIDPDTVFPVDTFFVIDKDNSGNDITVTLNELRSIELGVPLTIEIIEIYAEVPWENEQYRDWSDYKASIDKTSAKIVLDMGNGVKEYRIFSGIRYPAFGEPYYFMNLTLENATLYTLGGEQKGDGIYIGGEKVEDWRFGFDNSTFSEVVKHLNKTNGSLLSIPIKQGWIVVMKPPDKEPPKIHWAVYTKDMKGIEAGVSDNENVENVTAYVKIGNTYQNIILRDDDKDMIYNSTLPEKITDVYGGYVIAYDGRFFSKLNILSIPDIIVDDDIEDDPANHTWNTIQEGIDNANASDVIYVRNGTYKENIAIYKPLALIGQDNNNTIMDGGNKSDGVYVKANNVSISGFKIINGKSEYTTSEVEIRGEVANGSFTWTPDNFGGFWYDINDNTGNEMLKAVVNGRDVYEGNLIYTTAPQEVDFSHSGFGKYQVIGFMADKYFAGYTAGSKPSDNRAKSTIGSSQLHKVLLDDDEKCTVSEGGTLTLKEGYALKVTALDIGAGTGQVWITLLKDGVEVDLDVVAGNDDYYYTKKVGSVSDLPVIAVHFDSVFRGREVNAVFIRGVFQISESYTQVKSGDRYGAMEITAVSVNGINMKNDDSIYLSKGSTIDIAGNLKFKVADSDTLRFYPLIISYWGWVCDPLACYPSDYSYEIRGKIVWGTAAQTWDAYSFSGFHYDLDQDIKTEKLSISGISGRAIGKGILTYQTYSAPKYFNIYKYKGTLVNGQANYSVMGWEGEKYVAVKGKANKIAKLICEQGADAAEKKTLTVGETWDIGDGWTLLAQTIDARASPRQVWFTLSKDGVKIDDRVVAQGEAYTYVEKSIAGESDVPLFITFVDSIFAGAISDMVQVRYTWLMSQDVKEIKSGDEFGKLKVVNATQKELMLKNNYAFALSQGSIIHIMGDIKFKVADSTELRYYPAVIKTIPSWEGASGIKLEKSENGIISDVNILNSSIGIRLYSANDNQLVKNSVSSDYIGIDLTDSFQNVLSNNTILSKVYGIKPEGYDKIHFNNSIDTSNKLNGKPIYYYFNEKNITFDGIDTDHLTLAYSTGFKIKNSIIGGDGISLYYSENNIISSNTFGSIGLRSHGDEEFSDIWNYKTDDYNKTHFIDYTRYNESLVGGIAAFSDTPNKQYMEKSLPQATVPIPLPEPIGGGGGEKTRINLYYSYYNNITSNTLPSIVLDNSYSNTLINNNASITLYYSGNNVIDSNNASNNTIGIYLLSSSNNSLSHNNVLNNTYGIYIINEIIWCEIELFGCRLLSGSGNNILSNNTADNNIIGIYLSSSNNTLTFNTMSGNTYNFDGYYDNNIDMSNSVDGKYIYNLRGARDAVYEASTNCGIFYCIDCANVTIKDMALAKNGMGIYFLNTTKSEIQNVSISNNLNGIHMYNSSNSTLTNNTVVENSVYGIYAQGSSNKIYHNNFINNTYHAFDYSGTNSWHSGYPSGGNYWSDYTGADNFKGLNQNQPGSDGIGDTPYNISGGEGAQDMYPFMRVNGWLQEALRGDVNRNNRRDTGDATLILRNIVGLPIPSQYLPILPTGDMNCNSRIDTGDATLILRDVVSLPIPRCWE